MEKSKIDQSKIDPFHYLEKGFTIIPMKNDIMAQDGKAYLVMSTKDYDNFIKKLADETQRNTK